MVIDPFYWLIDTVLMLAMWAVIVWVILSWLMAFNVVNTRNQFVYMLVDALYRLTEPMFRPFRRILPNLGGIDLSPVAVILLLTFLRLSLANYWPF